MPADADDSTLDELFKAAADARPTVSGYALHEPLGSGGESDVYKATQTASGLEVAVKVFRGPNPARFRVETDSLARLNHPYVVRLLDRGFTADGRPFLAMPLYPGSLDRRYPAPGELSAGEVAGVVATVADAAQAAHALGIVHRDIKPSNVLVGPTGEPCLSDFGLARDTTAAGPTVSGAILGTVLYMAPEQAAGDGRHATPRTDVYGLGTVLYWLLTGRPPFDPTPDYHELLRRVKFDDPRPLSEAPADVRKSLGVICLRCLTKSPADRYGSAAELAEALRNWEQTATPPRLTWVARARKWWGKLPAAVRAATISTAAGLAVSAVLAVMLWLASVREEVAHEKAKLADERASAQAEARARVAVRNALDRGWQRLRAKQAGWTKPLHDDLGEVYRESRSFSEEDREAARLEARSLYAMSLAWVDIEPKSETYKLPSAHFEAWPAVPHPDGKWIAVGTPQGPYRLESGQTPIRPANMIPALSRERMARLAYSLNGVWLAFAPAAGGLQVWDASATRKIDDLEIDGPRVLAIGFGNGVVRVCRTDGRVKSWGVARWGKVSESVGPLTAAAFTADASRLVVGDAAGHVRELTGEKREWKATGVRTAVESVAWSPDGNTLAAGFKEGVVCVWGVSGEIVFQHAAFGIGVDSLTFSPDGSTLFAHQTGEQTRAWHVPTGAVVLNATARIGGVSRGHVVALSEKHGVTVGVLTRPQVVLPLRGHRTTIRNVAWSADGCRLATLDVRWEVRVWDTKTGQLVDEFRAPPGEYYPENAGLALDLNGQYLAYATGGRASSRACIRDITNRVDATTWSLPGGFEHLAPRGDGTFRLVREEFENGGDILRTVNHILVVGKELDAPAVIRRSRPGDTQYYLKGLLTPDARHYIWLGPRNPVERRRVEVVEVDTARVVHQRLVDVGDSGREPGLELDSTGRLLRITEIRGPQAEIHRHVLELPSIKQRNLTERPHSDWEKDTKWVVSVGHIHDGPRGASCVVSDQNGRPWLDLPSTDVAPTSPRLVSSIGPGSKRLAWFDSMGTILVTELSTLIGEVEAFEAKQLR